MSNEKINNHDETCIYNELAESRRKLATLMDNLPGIAYRCLNDRNWTMEFISCGCLELTEYNVEELLYNKAVSYNDLIHYEDREMVWEGVQDGVNNRRPYRLVYRIKTKTGITKWVWEQGRGVYSDTGELISIEGFITDITEKKKAEAELQKYREHLESEVKKRTHELLAANKELEAFAYSVSHDLRAPLRAIDGFSRAILEDYASKLDDEGADFLKRIRNASQKMARLIDDMLKLSRLTRDSMQYTPVNMSEIADEIIKEHKESEPGREVEFINTPGLIINGDHQLLHAALENLLGNAWKFTSLKNDAQIEFGTEQIDGKRVYFIRDNGAGFDMNYADKLFGAFQRLHAATEFPGTGIGLAIVQRVITRHGGKIWAESEVDRGSTFFFTL
jgi:PAS domain S-box-containing protein